MTLRDRCQVFFSQLRLSAMLRVGSPVDDLVAFVIAETGRAADPVLENTLPLCLYFVTKEDREEFMRVVHDAFPTSISKPMP